MSVEELPRIAAADSAYIDRMRGFSILRVVLGHLGLFWILPPYSSFLHAWLPLLFFVSGAVSYFSFRRSVSPGNYLRRRLVSAVMPFYVIAAAALLLQWLLGETFPEFTTGEALQWLTLSPSRDTMPFPLGQVWFIHALVGSILLSPWVFAWMNRNVWWSVVPILISLSLVTAQLFGNVAGHLHVLGHNLYQPLANMGFFYFGSLFYARRELFTGKVLWTGFLASLALTVALVPALKLVVSWDHHTYSPDLYYFSGSIAATLLVIIVQRPAMAILAKLRPLDWSLLYVSKHSYAIYLLHTLFILWAEEWFGLVGVMGYPLKAATKVLLVIGATFLSAWPVDWITKAITRRLSAKPRVTSVAPAGPASKTS